MKRSVGRRNGILIMCFFMLAAAFSGWVPPAQAADEFDTLRGRWKEVLTGGSSYSTSDPDIQAAIGNITANAQNHWNAMVKTGGNTRTYLWSDLYTTYANPDQEITENYQRLRDMAVAYSTTGSSLQNNTTLLADIIGGLEWVYANKYNTTVTKAGNWYAWEIGGPERLNDTVVLLYGQLTASQITKFMDVVEFYTPSPTTLSIGTATGANRLSASTVVAIRGVIVKNGTKIASARNALSATFTYVTSGDGFYTDGSFIQHSKIAYTHSYGNTLLKKTGNLFYLLKGSTWEVTDTNKQNVYKWVYDSFEPLIYKGAGMDMVRGRMISYDNIQDHNAGHSIISGIIRLADTASAADATAYKRMVKYWISQDTYRNYLQTAPLDMVVKAKTIMNDSAVTPRGELVLSKQFPGMNRTVHLRPGFGFGISMYSNRIMNYEMVNNENYRGWYTGYGMTYLYNNDLGQYSGNFWPTVNPYRLPGTTVDTRSRTNSSERLLTSTENWVGGVTLGNLYSVTGMSLKDNGSTLTAKKSWFMFDDEIVALGAGITSTDSRTIETIVENRKLTSSGTNAFTVNGTAKSTALGWSETMSNVSWAHLAGNVSGSDIGYYFPGGASVKGLRETRTGKWSDLAANSPTTVHSNNFLTMWFDHGANPSNRSYSYALLPGKTSAQVSSYAASPNFTIVANNSNVQAVKETALNIVGANFWTDSVQTADIVTSDKKASVMVKTTGSELDVSVADPTHANGGTINVEIARSASAIVSTDSAVTVTQLSPTIKLSINTAAARGKTFKAKLTLGTPPAGSTTVYEAETLSASMSSGDTRTTVAEAAASAGSLDIFDASAVGDYISYSVPVSETGTYQVSIRAKKHKSRGIYQLSINGANQGSVMDHYASTESYVSYSLGTVTFTTTGTKTFKFTVAGKHSSATDFNLGLDSITLTK